MSNPSFYGSLVKSPKHLSPCPRAQLLHPVLEGRDVLAVMPGGAPMVRAAVAVGKIPWVFDIYPLVMTNIAMV